jgi:hypothetical protein
MARGRGSRGAPAGVPSGRIHPYLGKRRADLRQHLQVLIVVAVVLGGLATLANILVNLFGQAFYHLH